MVSLEVIWDGNIHATHRGNLITIPDVPRPAPKPGTPVLTPPPQSERRDLAYGAREAVVLDHIRACPHVGLRVLVLKTRWPESAVVNTLFRLVQKGQITRGGRYHAPTYCLTER